MGRGIQGISMQQVSSSEDDSMLGGILSDLAQSSRSDNFFSPKKKPEAGVDVIATANDDSSLILIDQIEF